MKKFLIFLLLSGILAQCSTSTDDNLYEKEADLNKPKDLTISFNIEGNLMNEFQEKTLYISNEEGVIEGQIPLLNNQEHVLNIAKEPKVQYDLIVYDKSESFNHTRHTFNVYQNIESAAYTIDANYGPRKTAPKLDLNLVNTGLVELIGHTGGSSATGSSIGGGSFNLKGSFLTNPGDFFSSFKKEGESSGRYFWIENIEEDISISQDYEELPSTTLAQTQLPEHDNGAIFIFGYTSSYPGAAHRLSSGSTQGYLTYETHLPTESIFNLKGINTTLSHGNTSYRILTYSESLPSIINVPSFDLDIISFSHNNVDFTTTGAYDYSVTTFVSSVEIQEVVVIVNVHSEPGSRVSFSIAELADSISGQVPIFDLSQLIPSSISLTSLSYRDNYAEAIKGNIENKFGKREPGYLLETVTRRKE